MRQVLPLDAFKFRVVVVRRIRRPAQQYQLKRFEIHTSFWHRRPVAWRDHGRLPAGA